MLKWMPRKHPVCYRFAMFCFAVFLCLAFTATALADSDDSEDDDTFTIGPDHATVDLAGDGNVDIVVDGFPKTFARSTEGGTDTVELYDATDPAVEGGMTR